MVTTDLIPKKHNISEEHSKTECQCLTPPSYNSNFSEQRLEGYDKTNGRYGEVLIDTCNLCGTKWLQYFVEYEAFTKSGRWYRGIITDEVSLTVIPENAMSILQGLDWWVCGGSYYDGKISKGRGRLKLGIY